MQSLIKLFTKAAYSAGESTSFIKKGGTVEEKNELRTQYLDHSYIKDLLCLENYV